MKRDIVIFIITSTISIVGVVSQCSKDKILEKSNKFNNLRGELNKIEFQLFKFDKNNADSLKWMEEKEKAFSYVLDSGINYYRANYSKDETMYKGYLDILYCYKKLSYVYQDWIKFQQMNIDSPGYLNKYVIKRQQFYMDKQNAKLEMGRSDVNLLMH